MAMGVAVSTMRVGILLFWSRQSLVHDIDYFYFWTKKKRKENRLLVLLASDN
jgi:hypothetical protein